MILGSKCPFKTANRYTFTVDTMLLMNCDTQVPINLRAVVSNDAKIKDILDDYVDIATIGDPDAETAEITESIFIYEDFGNVIAFFTENEDIFIHKDIEHDKFFINYVGMKQD